MDKIILMRQSGYPVDMADMEAYNNDWRVFFDKAGERAGLDMMKKQRFLAYGERQLLKKHNKTVEIPLPKTIQEVQDLIALYQDTPIMFARLADKDGVVALLMDKLM
jgi:hypothetical protein